MGWNYYWTAKAKTNYLFDKAYSTEAVDRIVTSKLENLNMFFFR